MTFFQMMAMISATFCVLLVVITVQECDAEEVQGMNELNGTNSTNRSFIIYSDVYPRSGHFASHFTRKTWKTAAASGIIYGGRRYLNSDQYWKYPDRMPSICRNDYYRAPDRRVYRYFICPKEDDPSEFIWCCGSIKEEFCCGAHTSRSSSSIIVWSVCIVVVVLLAIFVIGGIIYMKKFKP